MQPRYPMLSLAVCGAVLIALSSCTTGPSRRTMLKTLDANGDERVDRTELRQGIETTSFDTMDADRNRQISRKEWTRAFSDKESQNLFSTLDTDKNGSISFSEYATYLNRRGTNVDQMFRELDKDSDGYLSDRELNSRPTSALMKWTF